MKSLNRLSAKGVSLRLTTWFAIRECNVPIAPEMYLCDTWKAAKVCFTEELVATFDAEWTTRRSWGVRSEYAKN